MAAAPVPVPVAGLWARVRPQMGWILLGCLCLGATNALALAIPWLLKGAVDALRVSQAAPLAAVEAAGHVVARNAALIVALAAAQAAIRITSRVLIFNSGRHLEYRLRADLFAHLTRLEPAFFRSHATGDLMSRLTNDLSSVRMLFGPALLNAVNSLIVYGSGLWLLAALSPRLTLLALLPVAPLVLGGRLFGRATYRASRALQEELGRLSAALQEDLAGITVVKLYGLEDHRRQAFHSRNEEYLRRSLALARARGSLAPLFAVIGGIGTLIVLWAGGREVILGRMTMGQLIAFNAYLLYLSWPTVALGWTLSLWQRGIAAWSRLREILETPPTIADPHDRADAAVRPALVGASISMHELTIEAAGRKLLDGVSFEAQAGARVAIVGTTGAGKTTLVDTIPRLTDVPAGTVVLGGHDVTSLPLQTLRSSVGYAPQEPFLFSDTLLANIAFSAGQTRTPVPANIRRRVRDAAEAAGLERDLESFPDGLDTVVGERGIMLSGGQRQRAALARALFSEPAILLLDDSLSSVDAETEREILGRLGPLLQGRTSVLVSHRIAAVKDADLILVMDAGKIVESGRHEQLLAAGGLYASLYRDQLVAEGLEGAG